MGKEMETKREVIFNLLDESFPGINANILRCEKLGFTWKSKPFFKEENEKGLSHVGFLEYPILVDGKVHKVGALHAVCTQQACRGRGLASMLIQEALRWAEKQYEIVVLFTDIPEFYEKLSFRRIQEHRFLLPCKRRKGSLPLRAVTSPEDNGPFSRSFQTRAPTSNRLWMKDEGSIASFNALFATQPHFWSLHYSPFIDGFISFELKGKTLHLYDIISYPIPSLETILNHLPEAIEEIYFYFSPDLFTDKTIPEPYLYDHGHFLVYGKWLYNQPFMIAPLSRC